MCVRAPIHTIVSSFQGTTSVLRSTSMGTGRRRHRSSNGKYSIYIPFTTTSPVKILADNQQSLFLGSTQLVTTTRVSDSHFSLVERWRAVEDLRQLGPLVTCMAHQPLYSLHTIVLISQSHFRVQYKVSQFPCLPTCLPAGLVQLHAHSIRSPRPCFSRIDQSLWRNTEY